MRGENQPRAVKPPDLRRQIEFAVPEIDGLKSESPQ
jgi:hypothetical protein